MEGSNQRDDNTDELLRELQDVNGKIKEADSLHERKATIQAKIKNSVKSQMQALAEQYGFKVKSITFFDEVDTSQDSEAKQQPEKSSRRPAEFMFVNPEQPDMRWPGRGARPAWYVEAIKDGKTAKDLAIANPDFDTWLKNNNKPARSSDAYLTSAQQKIDSDLSALQ